MERQPLSFGEYMARRIRQEAQVVKSEPLLTPQATTYLILENLKRKANKTEDYQEHVGRLQLGILENMTDTDIQSIGAIAQPATEKALFQSGILVEFPKT